MGAQGFPPRLDIFKAMAENWYKWEVIAQALPGYDFSTDILGFASTLGHQIAGAGVRGPSGAAFGSWEVWLSDARSGWGMWNVDEKGFTLGAANRDKVIACTGRRPPWMPKFFSFAEGLW